MTQETTSTATTPARDLDGRQRAGHGAERRRAKRIRERRAQRAGAPRRGAPRPRQPGRRQAPRHRPPHRQPATFLCVEGDGKQLFNGTLSGARTFRGRVVRLNIGLGPTTRLTANGKVVPLTASPTGLELTPK